MKIELQIVSCDKQNRDFDLKAILCKVAISTSMLDYINR